jgi:transposase-like protein
MGRTVDEGKWAEWRRRLARHEEWSGSVAAFCEREGVSVAAFYQWRRKLEGESRSSAAPRGAERPATDAPPLFLPVRIAAPAQVEIDFPDGVRMRVPAQATAALEAVVGALSRVARGEPAAEARGC